MLMSQTHIKQLGLQILKKKIQQQTNQHYQHQR